MESHQHLVDGGGKSEVAIDLKGWVGHPEISVGFAKLSQFLKTILSPSVVMRPPSYTTRTLPSRSCNWGMPPF